jgi:DNA mismatch repair protein MutL
LLQRAYEGIVPSGKYPVAALFCDIDPELVDVNIHPAKREVKFFDRQYVERLITGLGRKALGSADSAYVC